MKRHLDLFSGLGGFALASEACGYETIAFVECDPFCHKVLARHWPGVPIFPDVRKFAGDDEHGKIDLITAGVPCQPASIGAAPGGRGGVDDERWLWGDAIRIIGALRPRYALLENPTGLLSVDGGRGFAGILSDIYSIGFDVWWENIPARAVGAPHNRERIWLLLADPDRQPIQRVESEPQASTNRRPPRLQGRTGGTRIWNPVPAFQIEPDVGRVASRVPDRIHRLKALGNAICPHIAYNILKRLP